MTPVQYIRPASLAEALTLLSTLQDRARILAGGTDLLIELRRSIDTRRTDLIDIGRLGELQGITLVHGVVHIGSLTTHADLAASEIVRRHAPLLAAAAATIGSRQIRNRGTIGGNLMNASTCADTIPPLVALGASVTLRSLTGERGLNLVDLFVEPYRTVARPDEILTEVRVPALVREARSAFLKVGRRNAMSIARLSVASVMQVATGGTIKDARIVPGAAFPTWRRIGEAETLLQGRTPSPDLFREAGRIASREMVAATGRRWSTEYKEQVLAVLVRRSLDECMRGYD